MFKVGIRYSRLSQIQAQLLLEQLGVSYRLVLFKTRGDIDKETPIDKVEDTDFFTDAIDNALLKQEIDFAIHSAKDLPQELPAGLEVIYKSETPDRTDSLISRHAESFFELKPGSVIGTSSKRRKENVKRLRPDLIVADIRGTIEERLRQLEEGRYDAIIMATIALKRLGLEKLITQVLPETLFEPHPEQGRLAVVALKKNTDLVGLFSKLKGLAI